MTPLRLNNAADRDRHSPQEYSGQSLESARIAKTIRKSKAPRGGTEGPAEGRRSFRTRS